MASNKGINEVYQWLDKNLHCINRINIIKLVEMALYFIFKKVHKAN